MSIIHKDNIKKDVLSELPPALQKIAKSFSHSPQELFIYLFSKKIPDLYYLFHTFDLNLCRSKSPVMRKVFFFIFILLLTVAPLNAARHKYITSIPFEVVGSYVVITVRINESTPLKLILDSGIRNTIVTELTEGDYINLNYSNVKELIGLGSRNDTLKAYSSNSNTLKIGKLKFENKNVFVLKEDFFNLSRHMGVKINGLIGMDLLLSHAVEVNFSKQKLYFYEAQGFTAPELHDALPIETEGAKMFLDLTATPDNDTVCQKVRMLIDTGAELTAWFQTYRQNALKVPAKAIKGTIGEGFNGEVFGAFARLNWLALGKYKVKAPVVAFPDSVCIADVIGTSERDGTIGSQFLSRFNYIIDFPNKQFYFQPNKKFGLPFNYNIAGIEIVQMLPGFSQAEVWRVWKNSPADKAGILPGDQIIEINGKKSFELDIAEIKALFQNSSRHSLTLEVRRGTENIRTKLDMTPAF